MAHGGSAGQATQQAAMNDWRQAIETFYPDWDHQTYCVPPLYFNRVPYDTHHVAGLRVLVQQPLGGASSSMSSGQPRPFHQPATSSALRSLSGEPARVQETDTRDDFAQQHVMHCVQALGETQHEPMFVISQLNYADYLNKPAYAQVAQQLPRPVDLSPRDRDGDFDILIPHMHYGILIGEIRSVGLTRLPTDADVSKKVKQAVNQLNKSERVVRHITQDMAPGVRITNTLIFPYVTSRQMEQVIMADRNLQQAVCATLGAPDVTTAVQLCLCADQLSDKATPHHITLQTMTQLSGWFKRRVSGTVDPAMTRDVYINMLARAGPRYRQMVDELFHRDPGVSLWAATMCHTDVPPGLHVEALTVPLRSAPVIVREVGRGVDMASGDIHGYTASPIHSASDGPAIIRLRHQGGHHAGRWPIHCHQCGREVAHVLRHQLRVGVSGPVTSGSTTTSPPPLQYRDVLVLTRDVLFSDDVRDNEGNVTAPASGFVTGLRAAGIPVCVIMMKHNVQSKAQRTDMAEARTDQVIVTNFTFTHGLERKVVVYLPGRLPDEKLSDEEIEAHDKLFSVSRCSCQLVMVDVPPAAVRELMHQALMIRQFMAAYNRVIRNLVMARLIRELMAVYEKHRARDKNADNDSD